MPVSRITTIEFLNLPPGTLLLDVRSPAEYAHARIPGAYNLPLFSDEERKTVGTLYKQSSREVAIKAGLDFFGPKMRGMAEEVENLAAGIYHTGQGLSTTPGKSEIFIYCWRGGMRSAAVAWLLDLYGFRVHVLAGGYKSFRNFVLKSFELPYNFKILGGYTGSGKSTVLRELEKKGETIIDLEKIAAHKGSAFGNIECVEQPRPEMFENILALELFEKSGRKENKEFSDPGRTIWLEDESQRIGDLNIPKPLWETMRAAPVFFLDIDFEHRLENICREYGVLPVEKLAHATGRISKRLGPLETKNTLFFLENGNIKEAFRILLTYYDKHYKKGLYNRSELEKLLTILPCPSVSPANACLLQNQYQLL